MSIFRRDLCQISSLQLPLNQECALHHSPHPNHCDKMSITIWNDCSCTKQLFFNNRNCLLTTLTIFYILVILSIISFDHFFTNRCTLPILAIFGQFQLSCPILAIFGQFQLPCPILAIFIGPRYTWDPMYGSRCQ